MALTTTQLIGTPAKADGFDLDTAVEIGKKATGGSSAIAVGRVVFHTTSSGLWAIATSGSTGRMGVVPKLAPANADGDDTLQVVAAPRAQIYVEAAGAIKPGAQVKPTTGGKVIDSGGAQGFAVYKGHYGEGSGLENDPTDAANAEAVRIELSGDVI